MALTGKLTHKGLDIDNAHLKVMTINHRAVDTSTEAEDGTVTWSKANHADYSARVYKDAAAYAADPDAAVYTISGTFTPSVANSANLNIVRQTYEHLKTLADYDELTDC
tara:strand:- start:64 stop:390 length:327 start_codon:yes stop_codon:yes gene_type:complete